MFNDPSNLSLTLGFALILIPHVYSLIVKKYHIDIETSLAITLLKNFTELTFSGLLLIFLGILYKMGGIVWLFTS